MEALTLPPTPRALLSSDGAMFRQAPRRPSLRAKVATSRRRQPEQRGQNKRNDTSKVYEQDNQIRIDYGLVQLAKTCEKRHCSTFVFI